jgi:hypothetical protein
LYVGLGGVCVVNIVTDDEQVVIVIHGDGKKNVNMARDNPIIVPLLLAHQITSTFVVMVSMQVFYTLLKFMVYQTIQLDYMILFYPKKFHFD